MTRDEALAALRALGDVDNETAHIEGDKILLRFIADPEIAEAWLALDKWFA